MAEKKAAPRTPGFLERLSPAETLILAAIVMAGLAGVMLVGKGLALKAQAGIALF
ncbi:hypothetical protein [Ensifer soli]|uniref:hypothetical protein n=1 Tax=Ciceribacter sp. sgz301302 TaxID=3342379 RepID=UPI0035B8ED59